jgi:predicted 2-oxoglutarate/Fe(II)-dependent dioxygenase YbiX
MKDKTIIDTAVRNTWQLEPNQFKINSTKWIFFLQKILTKVQLGLGMNKKIKAHLYKLLLYETGSLFKPHVDTEKEENMFATLVIQLPSQYTGGELIVKHKGQTHTFDHSNDHLGMFYSAFYADCEHELKPVQSGYRLCLIYNLICILYLVAQYYSSI